MRIFLAILLCVFLAGCATTTDTSTKQEVGRAKSTRADVEVYDIAWLDKVIAVFSNELKRNPNQPGLYYNRAVAYFCKKDFEKSWQDLHKAQSLGCVTEQSFLDKLRKGSGTDN
jgi:hypothetical protein